MSDDIMEISDELWREVGFVLGSKNRTGVMKALSDDVMMPSRIARKIGMNPNHVAKYIKELRDHGLIECINPEARKGRLYRLTEDGEKVAKRLP